MRYILPMGPEALPRQGRYVGQLVTHASSLQREAHTALQQGDYERAAELIDDAEMLAVDVGALVDAMEERQIHDLMALAAEHHAGTVSSVNPRKPMFGPRSRRVGVALGAGVAMSLALVEC